MSLELGAAPEPVGWVGNRNFIVPPDVIPVRRVSPIPKRKRTLCRPRPDGEPVCRAGDREWFSDHLFVDGQTRDWRTVYGTSMTVHASCLIGLLVLLAGPPHLTTPVRASSPLRMPAFVAVLDGGGAEPAGPSGLAAPARRVAPPSKGRVAKAEPPKQSSTVMSAPHPVQPEAVPDDEQDHHAGDARTEPDDDTDVGAPDGDPGGAADTGETNAGDGNGEGASRGGAGGAGSGAGGGAGAGGGSSGLGIAPGPYRLGQGIEPPRKIKDVAPVYPSDALASRALGTVVIDAIVGPDGRVHDATVVHSIPLLDQAAIDAVRQWEFAPATLNGVAVAVIVTILVQFSIH